METAATGGIASFLPLIIVFVLFYFVLIMPQKKQEKKQRAMLNALEVGDEVITIGGIYGKLVKVKDDYVVLETSADKTKIKMSRSSISSCLTDKSAPAAPKKAKAEEKAEEVKEEK